MSTEAVAYLPDLMDRSRLSGRSVAFVAAPADLAAAATDARVVVVDLVRPGALDAAVAVASTGTRVVGVAPHVDDDLRRRAVAGGVEVLTRSRFFADPDAVLSGR